jgi:NTP pyrophosphatase (non-canonical NTP hydrolase)
MSEKYNNCITLSDEQLKTLEDAILDFGKDMQLSVAIEEMAELMQALVKYKRSSKDDMPLKIKYNIAEEMADVIITLTQLNMIFKNTHDINQFIDYKIYRLQQRLLDRRKLTLLKGNNI